MADGAAMWYTWQKGLAALRVRCMENDPEAVGPGDVAYSRRSQRLWCELSAEVLGPEWRKQLKVGEKTPRLPHSGTPHLEPSISVLVAKTERTLPPTSKAGGAPAPKSS